METGAELGPWALSLTHRSQDVSLASAAASGTTELLKNSLQRRETFVSHVPWFTCRGSH